MMLVRRVEGPRRPGLAVREAAFERECGVRAHFVQQNFLRSKRNVLRGLHYQIRQAQGKLVRFAILQGIVSSE